MMSRHSLSTWRNFSPSSGICLTMSSDEKMGSRYSHVCWHLSQLSSSSCRVLRVALHALASSSKGFTNGLAHMPCALTIWSSSSACTSSVPTQGERPRVLVRHAPNSRPSHSLVIFLSVWDSEYSFDACAPTFSSCSSMSMAPHSRSRASAGSPGRTVPFLEARRRRSFPSAAAAGPGSPPR